jgi:hypothetical protein
MLPFSRKDTGKKERRQTKLRERAPALQNAAQGPVATVRVVLTVGIYLGDKPTVNSNGELTVATSYLRMQGETFLAAVKRVARKLPEEGRALVVSHGGILEAAALHGCPRYHLDELGGEIGFCEAVVFKFDGEKLAGIEVKRLPNSHW